MNLSVENILLIGSVLLFISIIAGKTSYRFGVPTLLLFLAVGILAGSEGIGGIYFNNPGVAQFIGIVALNFILFSGGLDTSWPSVKPILWQGVSLSTFGVFLTAIALGLFVWQITDFTLYEGLLLGSIVSSTDAAAVFSILRGKNIALRSRLRPTLELESGSNDPTAYVLTIMFLGLVMSPEKGLASVIPMFLLQMVIGAALGFLFARLIKYVINKINLDYEGLYPVLVIAMMFATFSATDFIGGNGFLAVYLCGVYIGNQELIHKRTILKMFDGLAWLMQIVLFLTLGLLVFPSQIMDVMGIGLLISVFLILVARPIGVFISLLPFKMAINRRLFISWVGLRGAVPIVFATYPLLAGIEKAGIIFNIVFFISVTSILIQGTTIPLVAKWLKMDLPVQFKVKSHLDEFLLDHEKSAKKEILISENNHTVGKRIIDIEMPRAALIVMIVRDEKYITPTGSTVIVANDRLIILTNSKNGIKRLEEAFDVKDSDNQTDIS